MDEIVVGVDRSAPSRAALRWGIARARTTGSELRVIHVIDRPHESVDESLVRESRNESWQLVNGELAFARSIDPGIRITGEVAEGNPVEQLLHASETASLVVVGTHKTGFIQGNLFGSKFLGLAVWTETACAFIPEPSGALRSGVVAGLDDSEIGREVIRFAAAEAARTSQELVLICSSPAPAKHPSAVSLASEFSRKSYPDQLAWGMRIARAGHPDLRIKGRNTSRPAAESLVRAAAAASVLVIGHARTDADTAVMIGSLSLDVLLNISSPVIVLRGMPVHPIVSDSVTAAYPQG